MASLGGWRVSRALRPALLATCAVPLAACGFDSEVDTVATSDSDADAGDETQAGDGDSADAGDGDGSAGDGDGDGSTGDGDGSAGDGDGSAGDGDGSSGDGDGTAGDGDGDGSAGDGSTGDGDGDGTTGDGDGDGDGDGVVPCFGLDFGAAYWLDQAATDDLIEAGDVFGQSMVSGDFNDDGFADLIVGAPGEDLTEGAVYLFSGASTGLSVGARMDQSDTVTTPEIGDFFGLALAAGDLTGDGIDDFAVGAPGEWVGGNVLEAAGTVHTFHGSDMNAPTEGVSFSENFSGCGPNAAFNQFGNALAIGDLDGDGIEDLVIGIPGRNSDTGALCVMPASSIGVTIGLVGDYTAGSYGVGTEGPGDRFADTLVSAALDGDATADLAIGLPGAVSEEGRVQTLFGRDMGTATTAFSGGTRHAQDDAGQTNEITDRFGRSLAVGDVDGDGIAELAAGALESLGAATNTGAVSVFDGGATGPGAGATYVRGADVPGWANVVDAEFGTASAFGDFDGDGDDDLAVTAPGHANRAGGFAVFMAEGGALVGAGGWAAAALGGTVVDDAALGQSVASGDFDGDGRDDLAIGVPGESSSGEVSAGAVVIVPGCQP